MHTLEPWGYRLSSIRPPAYVITAPPQHEVSRRIMAGELPVTSVRIALLEFSHYTPSTVVRENARRIVACVNALAGVPTEFLESLAPGALADVLEGIIQRGAAPS